MKIATNGIKDENSSRHSWRADQKESKLEQKVMIRKRVLRERYPPWNVQFMEIYT